MRWMPLALVATLSAPMAFASDRDGGSSTKDDTQVDCTVDANPRDRVAKGRDVVIEAGETIDDAVAVDGNVTVRSGGRVKNALALHGSVTIEAGATVDASVIAIGGKANVAPGAKVKGSALSLDKHQGLHVRGEDGNDLDVSINIGGKNLANEILKPMIASIHRCKVIESRDAKK